MGICQSLRHLKPSVSLEISAKGNNLNQSSDSNNTEVSLATTAAEWTVSYHFDESTDNSIDVSDLTPTLLGMQRVCLQANEIMNGDAAIASLRIRATAAGSFDVDLVLFVTNVAVNVLTSSYVTSAANLKQILMGDPSVLGVLGSFKRLRGRQFKVSDNEDDDVSDENAVTIEAKELKIKIPTEVFRVLEDSGVQRTLHSMLTPLKGHSVERITIRDEGSELLSFTSDDFDEIETSEDEIGKPIEIPSQDLILSAPSLLNPNSKWRLHDGQTTHWYSVLDSNFIQRVTDGKIRFGTGDILTCHVRIIQKLSSYNTLVSEYEIVKVISHRQNERQMPLFE